VSLPILTDTHAHLDYDKYDPDREAVIQRAKVAGVGQIITIGIGKKSIASSLKLAETHPEIYAAVGVHPTALNDLDLKDWSILEEAARHPRVVAVGETGLDYHSLTLENEIDDREQQHQYFRKQLELAKAVNKPVIIHCRDAYQDTLQVLKDFGRFRDRCGVMHCFSADLATAQQVFELGYAISVGGVLTFKNATMLRKVVAEVPKNQLILETDCPYLAPVPHRGERNEPAHTRLVARTLADLWSLSLQRTLEFLAKNVKEVFGI
jgi:TatD DNase family protein